MKQDPKPKTEDYTAEEFDRKLNKMLAKFDMQLDLKNLLQENQRNAPLKI